MDFETKVGLSIILTWVVGALFSVAVTVGTVYALFHFIRKFW